LASAAALISKDAKTPLLGHARMEQLDAFKLAKTKPACPRAFVDQNVKRFAMMRLPTSPRSVISYSHLWEPLERYAP